MSALHLSEKIKQFYSLRIRIILSFTLLSFICVFTYGLLSNFIYEVVNDQLFNWHILETSNSIKKNNEFPQETKNRAFIIGDSKSLYDHISKKYSISEPFDNKDFETMNILDHKEVTKNQTIYEMLVNDKKLHIISIPRENQRQFLIYDISGFLEQKKNAELIGDRHVLWLTLPLALLVTIIGIFLGIILSKHVISPLSKLAETVRDIDPEAEGSIPKISPKYNTDEVDMLAETIQNMMIRINQFVEHERRFSREVSHELRTPVTSIGIAIDLLNASNLDTQQQKIIGRIDRASQDMAMLIQTFLMMGRDTIETNKKSSIKMKSCIEGIVEKNYYLVNKKPIKVIVDIAENEELFVNESLFNVIMSNLIRNSLQYTHNGNIIISGNHQKIKVADTGLGISDAAIELIGGAYNAFQDDGTGLGLSIVKRIAHKIGWDIEIESKENNGTTVSITPLIENESDI